MRIHAFFEIWRGRERELTPTLASLQQFQPRELQQVGSRGRERDGATLRTPPPPDNSPAHLPRRALRALGAVVPHSSAAVRQNRRASRPRQSQGAARGRDDGGVEHGTVGEFDERRVALALHRTRARHGRRNRRGAPIGRRSTPRPRDCAPRRLAPLRATRGPTTTWAACCTAVRARS